MNLVAVLAGGLRLLATHGNSVDVDLTTGLGGSAVGAFLTTLLVGAILVAIAPEYTTRMTDVIVDDPVNAFLYGIFFLLGLVIIIVMLVITIIGILVAIPLFIVAYVAWAVGSALAFLAIGERLIDDEDGDWKVPLLVGALINGGLTLTGVGGILSFAIGATGFGAVVFDWLD